MVGVVPTHVAICIAGNVLLGCNMLCILAPSSRTYPAIFWDYRLLLGANVGFEVPGSCGTKLLAKMPLMLGAIWEPKCLEVLGPRLPAKEPLISRAILGPACLEDGSQSAWKFWSPDCHQKSPQYCGQCWGQPAWKMGAKVPGSFEAQIASKNTLVFPTPCPPRGVRP